MNTFRFKVSLRFSGPSFDPSTLTAKLGMAPTYKWKVGERRATPKGGKLDGTYDTSYCTFNIEPHGEEDLSAMLERVSASLDQHKDLFNRISSDGNRIEFFIGWFSEGNTGEMLPFQLFSRLGELKIDLALDIYGSDRSTEIEKDFPTNSHD